MAAGILTICQCGAYCDPRKRLQFAIENDHLSPFMVDIPSKRWWISIVFKVCLPKANYLRNRVSPRIFITAPVYYMLYVPMWVPIWISMYDVYRCLILMYLYINLYHIVTFVRSMIICHYFDLFWGSPRFLPGWNWWHCLACHPSAWRAKASVQPSVVCYNAVLSALSRGARLDVVQATNCTVGSDRKCGILGLFTCLFTCFNSEIAGDMLLEVVRNACSFIFDMLMCWFSILYFLAMITLCS